MEKDEDGYEKVLVLPFSEDSKKVAKALSNDTSMKILDLLAEKPMSATAIAEDLGLALTTVKYNLDTLIESDLIKVKETKWSKKGRQIKIYDPVQKLIVVAPGKADKSSIMGMLQKYIGMITAAVFAAFGVEHLAGSANIGTAPQQAMMADLAMTKETPAVMATNDSMYEAPRMLEAEEMVEMAEMAPMAEVVDESAPFVESVAVDSNGTFYEEGMAFDAPMESTGGYGEGMLFDAPMENGSSDMVTTAMDTVQNNVSIPPEIASDAASQGLIPYDLASHAGVWFFFGCMFIIVLLLIREVYIRRKSM